MSMKIYFDMDGVLADFDSAARRISGAELNLNTHSKNLGAQLRAAKLVRWRAIEADRNFWADIPVMNGIFSVLDAAEKMAELFVLTSAPGAKNFAGGVAYVDFVEAEKRAWIARHMSMCFSPDRVIVTRIAKERRISPTQNDILIDDRVENVADWIAAGGRGIVFTSPPQVIKELTLINL